MKTVRTLDTNFTFKLEGGTEENDLPVIAAKDAENRTCMVSIWEPDEEERKRITDGEDVRLVVWGKQHPPVAVEVGRDFS